MEQCPFFEQEPPTSYYNIILTVIFCLGMLINPYVIYCIIYRSTKSMKSYRWYLLWHQILAFLTDISISFLAKPVFFLPFYMGYPAGILRGLVPTQWICTLCTCLVIISLVSVEHLFMYRYLISKGMRKFPLIYKIRIGFIYILGCGVTVQQARCYPDQAATIFKYSEKYTCISLDLIKITGFIIYDTDITRQMAGSIEKIFFAAILIETLYFIAASLRATTAKNMSSQLARLQRKFLLQLLLQTFIPLAFVCLPLVLYTFIVKLHTFGLITLGHLLVTSIASFSITGGIVLILSNHNYYPYVWVLKKYDRRKKNPRHFVIPSIQITHVY